MPLFLLEVPEYAHSPSRHLRAGRGETRLTPSRRGCGATRLIVAAMRYGLMPKTPNGIDGTTILPSERHQVVLTAEVSCDLTGVVDIQGPG